MALSEKQIKTTMKKILDSPINEAIDVFEDYQVSKNSRVYAGSLASVADFELDSFSPSNIIRMLSVVDTNGDYLLFDGEKNKIFRCNESSLKKLMHDEVKKDLEHSR